MDALVTTNRHFSRPGEYAKLAVDVVQRDCPAKAEVVNESSILDTGAAERTWHGNCLSKGVNSRGAADLAGGCYTSCMTRNMKSLEGHLLVASPHLEESTHAKSVVLLLSHHDEGALGVVLNRPMGQTIDRLWPQVSPQPCTRMEPVGLGGPESGPLLALHGLREASEHELPEGVFLAASRDHLEQLVQQRSGPLRLFVGHTRWTAGDLEQELERGDWHTLPATAEHVFSDEETLWADCLREVGRSVLIEALGLAVWPNDPTTN